MTDFFEKLSEKLDVANLVSDHHGVFSAFTGGLEDWSQSGEEPKEADQDVRYFMDLQHKRLEDHGLDYRLDFESKGQVNSTAKVAQHWKILGALDQIKFNQSLHYQSGILETRYARGGKEIHQKKNDVNFFQSILEPGNAREGMEDLTYVCDNCSFVTTIGDLVDACPSCGTHYDMGDFYPRVSNYWFTPNIADHEVSKLSTFVKGAFFLTLLATNILALAMGQFGIDSLFGSLFLGGIVAAIAFVLGNIFFLGKIAKEAKKSASLARQAKGSKAQTTQYLQQFDPAFTFDYFEHKTLSLLRAILFHPDHQRIPQFVGQRLPARSDDILDILYRGSISLDSIAREGDNIVANIGIYVVTTYDTGRGLDEEEEIYRLQMIHKADHLANPGFSMRKITCKSCGGSFDASHEPHCPFCMTEYDLSEEDWLVTSIERI